MTEPLRITAIAGSLRAGSFNKKLIAIAAAAAREAGAEVEVVDLKELSLPIFDEDLEAAEGPPPGATRLKNALKSSRGFIIASPEYNSSITAALKNAIDWASRSSPGEPSLSAFSGKVAAIMSASPGALGGLRGLVHLRAILGNIQVLVIPDQIAIAKAHEAFDEHGGLKDLKQLATVAAVSAKLVSIASRLNI